MVAYLYIEPQNDRFYKITGYGWLRRIFYQKIRDINGYGSGQAGWCGVDLKFCPAKGSSLKWHSCRTLSRKAVSDQHSITWRPSQLQEAEQREGGAAIHRNAGYFRHLIPNFSVCAVGLTDLTRRDTLRPGYTMRFSVRVLRGVGFCGISVPEMKFSWLLKPGWATLAPGGRNHAWAG